MSQSDDQASHAVSPQRPASPRGVYVVLWIIWAALLADAMVVGNMDGGHGGRNATAARMGSSVALVVAGVVGYLWWRRSRAERFMCLIAAGMALGALGDFFNAGLLQRIIPLPDPVLGGIASFGLGHIAYIAALVLAARLASLLDARVRYGWLAAWLVVGAVGWYAIAFTTSKESAAMLVWPALPYSLLLAATAGFASGLAAQDIRFLPLAIGAALFFISDLILAIGLFQGRFRYSTELVWLTYGPGQMLIVYAALAACPRLAMPPDRAAAATT